MKRGRPALRGSFQEAIADVLQQCGYPMTVRSIQQRLRRQGGRAGSWHTVKKYTEELARRGVIARQVLPVRQRRKPLIVYRMQHGSTAGTIFCEDVENFENNRF